MDPRLIKRADFWIVLAEHKAARLFKDWLNLDYEQNSGVRPPEVLDARFIRESAEFDPGKIEANNAALTPRSCWTRAGFRCRNQRDPHFHWCATPINREQTAMLRLAAFSRCPEG